MCRKLIDRYSQRYQEPHNVWKRGRINGTYSILWPTYIGIGMSYTVNCWFSCPRYSRGSGMAHFRFLVPLVIPNKRHNIMGNPKIKTLSALSGILSTFRGFSVRNMAELAPSFFVIIVFGVFEICHVDKKTTNPAHHQGDVAVHYFRSTPAAHHTIALSCSL